MPKVNIRLDEALYDRLRRRAYGADLAFSAFCRKVLEQAADPNDRYIYSSKDEILATSIQILSILATSVGAESPRVLEQGLQEARTLLSERGLLAEGARK